MEKHGRSLTNPWSSRQTGVYFQRCPESNASKWIFINIAEDTRLRLKERYDCGSNCCPLFLHVELLCATGANWVAYIEYLNSKIIEHVCLDITSGFAGNPADITKLTTTQLTTAQIVVIVFHIAICRNYTNCRQKPGGQEKP